MRLRPRQLQNFALAWALDQFQQDMIPHLRGFSPHHSQLLGPTGVLQIVKLGIERARAYGLTNPGLLRFYVELMFMYGSFFDIDPLLPWAGEVLRDPMLADPDTRATRLHEKMSRYYDTVSGPDLEFDRRALRCYEQVVVDGCSLDDPRFAPRLVGALFAIHPARASYVGEQRLGALVRDALCTALRLAIGTAQGVNLTAYLMFTRGYAFAEDPLLPWVRVALGEKGGDGPSARMERLEQAFYKFAEDTRGTVIGSVAGSDQSQAPSWEVETSQKYWARYTRGRRDGEKMSAADTLSGNAKNLDVLKHLRV